jgi:hypothetical protein
LLFVAILALLLDAGLNLVSFLEPGMTGIVAGGMALSLKKTADLMLAKRRMRKRAASLQSLFNHDQWLSERLSRERELYELGVISAEEFKTSLSSLSNAYRDRAEISTSTEKPPSLQD